MSTYDLVSKLSLEIDSYELEGLRVDVSPEFARLTTVIHLRGGGHEGIGEDVTYSADEAPAKVSVDKIPTLKPAFTKTGTVTAASSSSITDGAAAVVLMSSEAAAERGVKPLAKVVAHATHAQEPQWFTTAPVTAIEKVLKKAGWSIDEVDLFEINEAFACVAMAPIKQLGIPHAKVNVNGGACALGHPIGASGTRLIVTLLHALIARGGKRGVASLCIGGGEATAIAIELT